MDKEEIRQLVFETLEQVGIKVPAEKRFNYKGIAKPEKMREFIRLTQGDYTNAFYVTKGGNDYDSQFYDLLFAVNEKGEPICIHVPLAKSFLKTNIVPGQCVHVMSKFTYETIYKAYYDNENLPF